MTTSGQLQARAASAESARLAASVRAAAHDQVREARRDLMAMTADMVARHERATLQAEAAQKARDELALEEDEAARWSDLLDGIMALQRRATGEPASLPPTPALDKLLQVQGALSRLADDPDVLVTEKVLRHCARRSTGPLRATALAELSAVMEWAEYGRQNAADHGRLNLAATAYKLCTATYGPDLGG